jgi:nucleoside-diphosphate-sugar epimerase
MQNVCLRYFNVYGPNQRYDAYGGVIPIFSKRILKRQPLTVYGDGEQTRDFINVRDVASANITVGFQEGVKDVFNIGSGNQIKIKDLADWLQELAGVEVGIQYLPPRLGDILFSQADITKARETFGFAPTVKINDGLAEYLAWIKGDEITQAHLWDE